MTCPFFLFIINGISECEIWVMARSGRRFGETSLQRRVNPLATGRMSLFLRARFELIFSRLLALHARCGVCRASAVVFQGD